MATSYLILGQAAPANTSVALLYTVPSSTSTVVSTIVVCNTTATAAVASIYCNRASATNTAATAIVYQKTIPAYETQTYTLGITMTNGGTADTLYIQTGTANALTFTAFGSQIA
jgi:hypothetical protein